MKETWLELIKITLIIFVVGDLLGMGLELNPKAALRGLKDFRFVTYSLLWSFVLGPLIAWLITLVIPLEKPYAIGLILMAMTPCAPFLPKLTQRAKGDQDYTAAFMLLISILMVIYVPFAVPLLIKGLTVHALDIARPLLLYVFLPLAAGLVIVQAFPLRAPAIRNWVVKITIVITIILVILNLIVYGEGLLGTAGSLAIAAQLVFFFILAGSAFWLSSGLPREQKVVLSLGMTTRNIGVSIAPLFVAKAIDEKATVMLVLGFLLMIFVSLAAVKWLGRQATPAREP
jgi:BASS family bile acid:Na+ symporter